MVVGPVLSYTRSTKGASSVTRMP